MKKISLLYPEGKKKALTFSYDDGVEQDARLIDIFNKNGLKCTFNLNSENTLTPKDINFGGIEFTNIPASDVKKLYEGHEIATHSYSHPWFTTMHENAINEEIHRDRYELEKMTDYIVRGHAYPFGVYDKKTIKVLKQNGIEYARTVVSTDNFGFPADFMEWHPTCHHKADNLFELLERFTNFDFGVMLFYVWGHSYEFDMDKNWERMEEFCEKAGGNEKVWYATNIEICDYIKAFNSLKFSADGKMAYNPSDIDIYLSADGETVCVKSGETVKL